MPCGFRSGDHVTCIRWKPLCLKITLGKKKSIEAALTLGKAQTARCLSPLGADSDIAVLPWVAAHVKVQWVGLLLGD